MEAGAVNKLWCITLRQGIKKLGFLIESYFVRRDGLITWKTFEEFAKLTWRVDIKLGDKVIEDWKWEFNGQRMSEKFTKSKTNLHLLVDWSIGRKLVMAELFSIIFKRKIF